MTAQSMNAFKNRVDRHSYKAHSSIIIKLNFMQLSQHIQMSWTLKQEGSISYKSAAPNRISICNNAVQKQLCIISSVVFV